MYAYVYIYIQQTLDYPCADYLIICAGFYVVLLPGNIKSSSLFCSSQLLLSGMEYLSDASVLFYNLPNIIIIYM